MFFGRQICVCLILQLWVIGFCLNLNINDEEKVNLDSFNNNQDVVHATITVANTLHALEKIAFYYFKHKKEASVDFAFGMRAAEGEISRILHMGDIGAYPDVSARPYEKDRLMKLLETIQSNVKQSLPYIELKNKEYFANFYPLIKEKWSSLQFPPQRSIRDLSVFPNSTSEKIEENESDKCLMELMNENDKCQFKRCWKMMTEMGKSLYFNTHQILWLLLGNKIGCSGAMNKKAQEEGYANGITDILRKKCASAIIEMEAITEDGYRKGMIDIFLEQGFVCGSIGFMDAVRPQWLKLAFQWQDPNLGCFPDAPPGFDDEKNFKFWVKFKREEWKSRKLFVDYQNSDGCSSHMTAVGAAFYATYLRLFYDPFYKKNQLIPFLYPNPDPPPTKYTWKSGVKIAAFIIIAFVAILLEFKRRIILRIYAFTMRCCCCFGINQRRKNESTNFV